MRIPVTHIDDDPAPLRTPSNSRSRCRPTARQRWPILPCTAVEIFFDWSAPNSDDGDIDAARARWHAGARSVVHL